MTTGRILLDNLALDATLSGGSWGGTLDNVLDPRIVSKPARCADPSDLEASQFLITFDRKVYLTDLLIGGHTALLDSRYRVTCYEGETTLQQIGWHDIFGRIYPTSSLPFEQSNWYTGKPRLKDIQGYARHKPIRFPLFCSPDSILVELDVRDVAEAGKDFDIGYLAATAALTPGWTYDWGRELAIGRRTQEEVTTGGRVIKSRRTNARVHTVSFSSLTKVEAMAIYDRALLDDEHPIVFDPDRTDLVHEFREVFPAVMTVVSPPRQVDETGDWSVTLRFEEMQG
ncbi:hypothetical protein T8K17_01760 [Thalassobaculum sp. OXR-137]|uniref:hypothetical protein n=1 Tax=Thalassobaculum sp. OXR-137 TaxID=3100173 RepID=UPI002AC98563|nr:hypothetical protein [Thalassobaculum sp. OXR-137]WPZ34876.1 hypothetical protein T8K17_01760 [Thalassobaculum sp. OXR-137]